MLINYIRKSVLARVNAAQNGHYPPNVFDSHVNDATLYLQQLCADAFQQNQVIMEIIKPYLVNKKVLVKNGLIKYPDDYKHWLGMSIGVKTDGGFCEEHSTEPSKDELIKTIAKKDCKQSTVTLVSYDEFANLTTHSYKRPTYRKPITRQEADGFKICPFDCGSVQLQYIRKSVNAKWAYTIAQDGNYVFDETGSTDVEWDENAIEKLITACTYLYSIYNRDGELSNAQQTLKASGLF